MSELSDLLGGLLGSEAGKDSGGMDGLSILKRPGKPEPLISHEISLKRAIAYY